MADISKILLPNGSSYDVKDTIAREIDDALSSTSEKPLKNRVIYNMIADCAVNWRIDEETGLAVLVNRFGEDIGDALDITSSKTYKPKITNLLDSKTITIASGTTVTVQWAYESVDVNDVDDGPGTGVILCNNVSTASFNVIQGNNSYNVTSLLSAGENSVKLRVTNSEGTTREFIWNVIVLSLSLSSDLVSPNAYYGNVIFNYTLTGYGASKVVHFELDGTELATDTVTTSGVATEKTIPSQSAGSHTLRIWAVTTVNSITVTSNILTLNMIWATAALPDISVSSGQHVIRYFNYDGTYLYGYAATDGNAAIDPVTQSLITAPTKSGTSSVSYTYNGWNDLPASVSQDCAVTAKYTTSYLVTFMNESTSYATQWVVSGNDAITPATDPTKAETTSYAYVFAGWTTVQNGSTVEADALNTITAARTVYAVYTQYNKYTVRFMNGTTVLQTQYVIEGQTPAYTGSEPVHPTEPDDYVFKNWDPVPGPIYSDTDYSAIWRYTKVLTRKLIDRTLSSTYTNESVTYIGIAAFANCTSLVNVSFPEVTEIGSYAFESCTSLATASFPKAIYIRPYAFRSCTKLSSIYAPSATTVDTEAFRGCTSLTTVSFPSAVFVAYSTFMGCNKLVTAMFPNVGTIYSAAFSGCTKLQTLVVGTDRSTVCSLININAFAAASASLTIYVPDSLVTSYKTAAIWSTYSAKIKGISEYTG